MFKPIFEPLFQPMFSEAGTPPDLLALDLARTFTTNPLTSPNAITKYPLASARFVSSYAYHAATYVAGSCITYGDYFRSAGDHTISAWINPLSNTTYSYTGIITKRAGSTVEYNFYMTTNGSIGLLGVYDGGAVYNSTATISINTWTHVAYTYDAETKKVRFYKNGAFVDEVILVKGFNTNTTAGVYIGKVGDGVSQAFHGSIANVRLFQSVISDNELLQLYNNPLQSIATTDYAFFPLQNSTCNISSTNTGLRGTLEGVATFSQTNDISHYNLTQGFDKYYLTATPTTKLYIPYTNGTPVLSSVTNYTKESSHPPSTKFHNGAETKVVVGTNGTKDTNGWQASSTFYTPTNYDPQNIFINTTTGYCKEVDLNTLPQVSTGDYIFLDNTQTPYKKNLLWFKSAPTYSQSVAAHKYIKKTDFVTDDTTGELVFDENGFVVTEV